jgi:hypothetical protein
MNRASHAISKMHARDPVGTLLPRTRWLNGKSSRRSLAST